MKRSVSAVLARLRKSAPAQKEEPFPVMITQRTSGSALICSIAAPKSCSRSGVMELRLSGRFSVMVAVRSSGAGQATTALPVRAPSSGNSGSQRQRGGVGSEQR